VSDDIVFDCKHHGPFNPRREVACPHCMAEVRSRLAAADALLGDINSRDRHSEGGAYLVRMYWGDFERIDAHLTAAREGEK
jgi:hypothetical protein